MTVLRAYQAKGVSDTYDAWNGGYKTVMYRLACGMGKTPIIGRVCADHDGVGIATAHRSVLVTQISQQLAREGIKHSIIGSDATKAQARRNHIEEFGRIFVDPHSNWHVASVDTLVGMNPLDDLFKRATRFIGDESHHFLKMNKWGRAWHMCRNPNLYTLLPTATPARADGMGLGAATDGIADILLEGPDMRWGIENAFLTGYRIWCPKPTDLDLSGVDISSVTGDYNEAQLRKAMAKSTAIVGDIVSTYCKHARGKLGVTFAVDVSEAEKIVAAFNLAGVPAALISAKTPEAERNKLLKAFERRELWQLVNVDLFGEGFDLPAIECVSMGRPTASWPLFVQQFNRALRLMISRILMNAWDTFTVTQRLQHIAESQKPFALIFDHVGNALRHGLPDKPKVFTLDRRAKRTVSDAIPMVSCHECESPYEIIEPRCPWCGAEKLPPKEKERSSPNLVGGDIFELTDEERRRLLGDAVGVMSSFVPVPPGAAPPVAQRLKNIAHENRTAQRLLRHYVAWWAGLYPGEPNSKIVQRFYYEFGRIDMLSAFSLKASDAHALIEKIKEKLDGIVINDLDSIHQPQTSIAP